MPLSVRIAVEGPVDAAVLRKLLRDADISVDRPITTGGKPALLSSLSGYNNAARFAPWVVLIDLDVDADCAPTAAATWLPQPAANMCFRIAVRAVEAWLMADHENLARYLAIGPAAIPADPDRIERPKQEMVNLARRSRRRTIKDEMVPREGSARHVGIAYAAHLTEFALHVWSPEQAANRSDSLRRCIARVREIGPSN